MSLLAEVLRSRRERLGMSQHELATACNVGQQSVSRWEQGVGLPRPSRITKLAQVLDLEAEYLHRIAGFLPEHDRSPVWRLFHELYASVSELSDDELWLLADRLWEELMRRRGLERSGT